MKKQKQRSDHGNDWVKMNRSEIMDEVIAKNKNAWCLLSLIAKRAWRGPGINRHGCRVGEGFIGDYKEYGFTQMGYRVAKKQLEEFGFVSFRTTNRGTIAKLLGPEIFDINVDMSVTDRAEQRADNDQATTKQQADNEQAASKQRADNDQATTNKKLRMEEAKKEKNQKENNNNNAADAAGVGVVLPPSEVSGADAPGEEEEEGQPPAPVGDMPGTEEETPDHKVVMLSRELPLYVKHVTKLNQRPVFTASTLEAAREWFERNTDHEWSDILAVCALGIKNVREIAPSEDGFDPYFWSRKYAHKPNKLFETNADGDIHLALIMGEGKWAPDAEHGQKWITQLTESEAKLAVGKAK
jgi:hypothetical protein